MQQLIYFIRKYRYFLFFLFLQFIALFLTINNNAFHKSKFVNSANDVTGGFYNKVTSISDYFNLTRENNELINENVLLKNRIEKLNALLDSSKSISVIDTVYNHQYSYISGKIRKNHYANKNNFLLINLGLSDSVKTEMAVVNSLGIIGITEKASQNYTRVQSILNQQSKINAKLKKSDYFGTLTWDGKDYNIVQLLDIPRQAIVNKGDTIVTGGRSAIFPEGVLIGKVASVEQENTSVTRVINIELFNDMSNIKNIYVIQNFHKKEIENLEKDDE